MRNRIAIQFLAVNITLLLLFSPPVAQAQWDPNTKASNLGSIVNTRHNMTQSWTDMPMWMNKSRNDYQEVCVYCHTPHGSNSTINAPLWNRTNKTNTYTTYNRTLASGQTATQPGLNSLTCLSCHDGTVAIDSIINMPGSDGYSVAQETGQNDAFLDTWAGTNPTKHGVIFNEAANGNGPYDCSRCHADNNALALGLAEFRVFWIGTDLTDDHPVGVQLPNTAVYDFNPASGIDGSLKFYDTNSNGRADTNEVRFYDTGSGYEVECASCHDPHGVPSAGPGSSLIASFLRVDNNGSTLCLTCHSK